MRFINDDQRKILNRLHELSGWNPDLVYEAFVVLNRRPEPPTIIEVAEYVVRERLKWEVA